MPRKRTLDNTSSTENIATTSTDSPADITATEPLQSAPMEPAAAMPEPSVAEDNSGPGFAERVGQNKRVSIPDPFGIATDYIAGVRLFESQRDRQLAIKFGDGSLSTKPSQAVIDTVKDAGYRWNSVDRIWTHPFGPNSAMSTRIDAERLYQEVRQMIRKEKGIEPGQEVPF